MVVKMEVGGKGEEKLEVRSEKEFRILKSESVLLDSYTNNL